MRNDTINNENVGGGISVTNTDENFSNRMLNLRRLFVTQEEISNDIWKYEFVAQ